MKSGRKFKGFGTGKSGFGGSSRKSGSFGRRSGSSFLPSSSPSSSPRRSMLSRQPFNSRYDRQSGSIPISPRYLILLLVVVALIYVFFIR